MWERDWHEKPQYMQSLLDICLFQEINVKLYLQSGGWFQHFSQNVDALIPGD